MLVFGEACGGGDVSDDKVAGVVGGQEEGAASDVAEMGRGMVDTRLGNAEVHTLVEFVLDRTVTGMIKVKPAQQIDLNKMSPEYWHRNLIIKRNE